jgi:hypothetical protein
MGRTWRVKQGHIKRFLGLADGVQGGKKLIDSGVF